MVVAICFGFLHHYLLASVAESTMAAADEEYWGVGTKIPVLSAAAALGIGYLVDSDSLPRHQQQERPQQNSSVEDTPRRLDAAADTRCGGGHDHVV